MRTPKNRKKSKTQAKIHLVFDENKRREFLTGFHKRNVRRRQEAQKRLEIQLKAERKRLKLEAKEAFKKLVVSHRPIPELEHLLKEEYEEDDVHVKIEEISTGSLANQSNFIGINHPMYAQDGPDEENENDQSDCNKDYVPGMEITACQSVVPHNSGSSSTKQKLLQRNNNFQSQNDVKRVLRKEAIKKLRKSKVFQRKNNLEKRKSQKKSKSMKKKREKNAKRTKKKR